MTDTSGAAAPGTGRGETPTLDVINATWLLVGETPATEAWHSTSVGQDHFHREAPGA